MSVNKFGLIYATYQYTYTLSIYLINTPTPYVYTQSILPIISLFISSVSHHSDLFVCDNVLILLLLHHAVIGTSTVGECVMLVEEELN